MCIKYSACENNNALIVSLVQIN